MAVAVTLKRKREANNLSLNQINPRQLYKLSVTTNCKINI